MLVIVPSVVRNQGQLERANGFFFAESRSTRIVQDVYCFGSLPSAHPASISNVPAIKRFDRRLDLFLATPVQLTSTARLLYLHLACFLHKLDNDRPLRPFSLPLPISMLMTAQSIDQARQRYSQELAQHTKMQWMLARSEAQRRQQEGAGQSGAGSSVDSNGRGAQSQRSAAGSQDAPNHEPSARPPSSAARLDPQSILKVIDFADPSHQQ